MKKRIEHKIEEQSYIEELEDTYEALKEDNYPMEEVLTELAKEQNAISEKNLAEPMVGSGEETEAEADEKEEEEELPYDIYLRESARIMADWIMEVKPGQDAKELVSSEAK